MCPASSKTASSEPQASPCIRFTVAEIMDQAAPPCLMSCALCQIARFHREEV